MTKICFKNLEIQACHGVLPEEKTNRQPFVFDGEIEYDFIQAALTDNLAHTLDYGELMLDIHKFCTENSFDLIETLCYRSADMLMQKYPIRKITLTVKKPQAPVSLPFEDVSVCATLERRDVYLSLGSNIGDRQAMLDGAIAELERNPAIQVLKVSAPYENPPYGGVAQFPFINTAAKISTYLSPDQLLQTVRNIEEKAHRNRQTRWGDRTLDIDIIFFGNEIIDADGLSVPHVDYYNRDFVLIPMNEIAPDFVCPLYRKRISQLLKELNDRKN